ncbi:MAG: hypothetical protein ABI871_01230 [Chthoniobacterales bacterium]
MNSLRFVPALVAALFMPGLGLAAVETATSDSLALQVWKASGGENWQKVKQLRFTFVVEQDGKTVASAQHDWDVAAGTDHVKWKDKDVTVNLAAAAQDENSKVAYARWVNDSYWLLAPLKIRDQGVTVTEEGTREAEGVSMQLLRLKFAEVGLTSTDQYLLYVDPETKLVRSWDYIPATGEGMHATWDKYQNFDGLNLATEHSFNGKMVKFTDIEVIAAK